MKRFRLKKLNNEGAALILAMVIVLFITILTSLLLYVTGINYEMKTADYRTKVSFYGAETPLEELRVQLALDTSEASKKAYKEMLNEFTKYNTADGRAGVFAEKFYENIEKTWEDRGITDVDDATQWKAAIRGILSNTDYDVYIEGVDTQDSSKAYHIAIQPYNVMTGVQGTTLKREENRGRMLLLQIKVYYTEDDFLSVVVTDYAMEVPEIDWSAGAAAVDDTRNDVHFEGYAKYLNWEKQ